MQVVTPDFVKGKKVLLRMDLDVPLEKLKVKSQKSKVKEDYRLRMGLPTLNLCLGNASEVIVMGHLGRPCGKEVPELSVQPIFEWMKNQESLHSYLESGKLKLLENLRFESGEEDCDLGYAKELAQLGDVFVNEAFAAHNSSSSTTVLPTLLPHCAGLRFAEEVRKLAEIRENPPRPLIAIIGGAKVEDKLSVVEVMAKIADWCLVGGKLVKELSEISRAPSVKIKIGKLREDGLDITEETLKEWEPLIKESKMIVWNGPMGKIEEYGVWGMEYGVKEKMGSAWGSYQVAKIILESDAKSIIGGGDTVGFLGQLGLVDKFSFVSTGGGAMLKFLSEGTLPTIEVLG